MMKLAKAGFFKAPMSIQLMDLTVCGADKGSNSTFRDSIINLSMLKRFSIVQKSFLAIAIILFCALVYVGLDKLPPCVSDPAKLAHVGTPPGSSLPEVISPEGVNELVKTHVPHALVNADQYEPEAFDAPGPIRLIYYTTTPSDRAARRRVAADRKIVPQAISTAMKPGSQRLAGTPAVWHRKGLVFSQPVIPDQVMEISPAQLTEAIEDKSGIQIIDLRPQIPDTAVDSAFPDAYRWLPDELFNHLDTLNKDQWIVLVGLSDIDAKLLAFELFRKDFMLTAVLKGGYPAWIAYTGD